MIQLHETLNTSDVLNRKSTVTSKYHGQAMNAVEIHNGTDKGCPQLKEREDATGHVNEEYAELYVWTGM